MSFYKYQLLPIEVSNVKDVAVFCSIIVAKLRISMMMILTRVMSDIFLV